MISPHAHGIVLMANIHVTVCVYTHFFAHSIQIKDEFAIWC